MHGENEMAKMCLTVFSGSVDRLTGMAILVSGAAAMDVEVEIFLQLWGAYAFKKDVIKKNMNFSEFQDKAPEVAKKLQELNLPPWFEMLKQAKELGKVKVYVCSTAAKIWGAESKEDFEFVDEFIGAGEWIEKLKEADITLFI